MLKRLTPSLLIALGMAFILSSSANASIQYESIGTFGQVEPNDIIFSVAVDNSGGPSNGDVYDAHYSETQNSVEKFESDGKPTGVTITGAETPQGSFSFLSFSSFYTSGIAVDSSGSANSGDIYVADIEHDVVDKFSEAGHYVCQITGTATPSPSECGISKGSDTPAGSMTPAGLAVNSSGDLYVSDPGHTSVDEFGPGGEYIGQITDPNITFPGALAIDSNGNLYIANSQRFHRIVNVVEFNAKGEFVSVLDSNTPFGVAVNSNPLSNHVYVSEASPQDQLAEYDSSGSLLNNFGPGPETTVLGLSVNNTTGEIYAAAQNLVYIFSRPEVVPNTTTGTATDVQSSSATLNGVVEPDSVNGGGEVTSCQFEYGTTVSYGQKASCLPPAPYASLTSVTANVSLAPSTEYHFRVSATDTGGTGTGGTGHGEDKTLVTSGPPAIDSESSSNVVISSGIVHAQVNPYGFATTCEVQYVDQSDFEASGYQDAITRPCDPVSLGSGFGDQESSVALSGLEIGTTYHYRFTATNSAGKAEGADETFATFGVKSFSVVATDKNDEPYTQAGGHPYALTASFAFNTTTVPGPKPDPTDANPKDIETELPPGLIGNPEAVPKCTPYSVAHADCTGAAQVGMLTIYTAGDQVHESAIYNLVPPNGIAGQLGARFNGFVTAHINAKIRTGGNYGITADSLYISAAEGVTGAKVTIWGVPADPSHDNERYCPAPGKINEEGPCHEHEGLVPFLDNPTSCTGPQPVGLRTDSWQDPGVFVNAGFSMPESTECGKLDFNPEISIEPESHSTDSPTGLHLHLKIPQNEDPNGLAESQLEDAQVTLPQGMTVNPSAANGLQACTAAQIGMNSPEPADCPDQSKVGTVEIESPLVDHPLLGGVYVAAQGENPFGSLLALYIAVNDPKTGVVVKLAGKTTPDLSTGQLTTTFTENPQLPFKDLKLNLFGGQKAVLATPQTCGEYSTNIALTPWSAPTSPVGLSSPFGLSTGPGGAACAVPGFNPTVAIGTASNQAGSFSALTTTIARNDGEQRLKAVSVQMPPGVAGVLAGIPLCGEAQANEGACPAGSKIGHVTVTAGVGGNPVTLPEAGKPQDPVYLTGPYNGAPFGLSIVVPAEAGPFNLDENGKPIVVRARIMVDPHTAQVSVISDPLPSILQGIPTDVRSVNVTIDRERFTYNATNCRALNAAGTIGSTQGASVNVSSRYQAANCTALAYKPKFSASARAPFTRTNGVALTLKIAPPAQQANTQKVRLVFPKQLPTRLTTLKHACPAATFESNPAACSRLSIVGSAIAHTPVLANPLTGPIYLVSYGGAAFPDAEVVLQGEGIKLVMDGKTDIQKGITSSTFESVPDAPFTAFEAKLPAGSNSAFAAVVAGKRNGSLCGQKLSIGNIFVGQNGAEIKQSTSIGISGCPKAKKHPKTKKHPKKKR